MEILFSHQICTKLLIYFKTDATRNNDIITIGVHM